MLLLERPCLRVVFKGINSLLILNSFAIRVHDFLFHYLETYKNGKTVEICGFCMTDQRFS